MMMAAVAGCGSDESGVPPATSSPTPHSEYEVPVALPACDPADASVRILASEDDWADLNAEAYRIFCVAPGDYRGLGDVRLARDGTAEQPRVLRYYNPDDPSDERHPAQRAEAEQAFLAGMRVTEAHHWIVDGITVGVGWQRVVFEDGSSNNVINRLLLEGGSVVIRHGCNHNVVQNSVLRNALKTPGVDRVCMVLSGSNDGADVAIEGTRIVNNEIYDCTDAIQTYRVGDTTHPIDFGDTVIDNNDLFLTDGMYTDCNGNLDPAGACACAENAIDLKAAGSGPGNIVQVSNNRMWGYKPTDTACGGTGSSGTAVTVHFTARYSLFQGNVIWDAPHGLSLLNDHHSAVDNVIQSIHEGDDDGTAIYVEGPNAEIYRNIIVDSDRWAAIAGDGGDYRCNTIIDGGRHSLSGTDVQADYNFYYASEPMAQPGDHDLVVDTAADAQHAELCFEVRPWTGPEQVCIPNGKPAETSPHAGACDPDLGERPDVGVHDEPW